MEVRWRLNQDKNETIIKEIMESMKVSRFLATTLYRKGLTDKASIDKFLNPKMKYLYSPVTMKDIDKGTDIMIQAIKDKKHIKVSGDYDCDGIGGVFIMAKGLKRCGANVSYYLPDRIEDGYGLNNDMIRRYHEQGVDVIITVDNGISGAEQVALAKSLGMTVIVTDHHEVPFIENENGERIQVLPPADAVINPHQEGCEYPFKGLCGAGVAFKFIHTMYHKLKISTMELYDFLEVLTISTVCDVMSIIDENRVFVKNGLERLNNTKNIGLKALIKEMGFEGKKLNVYSVSFGLGPAFNSGGRLVSAELGLKLLMAEDESTAEALAKELVALNKERQELQDIALEEIYEQIETSDLMNDRVLVIFKADLHESLAGIIAGRIRDRYNKPTFVITESGEHAKGSGRSTEEYSMFEEMNKYKEVFLKFGGHPLAAGFSLETENIPLFRQRANELCTLTDEDLVMKIDVDDLITIDGITFDLMADLEKLEPFGKGNKEPLFQIDGVIINKIYLMGAKQEHFKLECREKGKTTMVPAIKFFEVDRLKELLAEKFGEDNVYKVINNPIYENLRMDLLFKPTINEYKDKKTIQMKLDSYRICE